MRSNAEFGKFLFEQNPQTRPAWLTLYNYLRNFCPLQAPLTPEVIFKFYLKALNFEHWQKNVIELSEDTKFLLQHFLNIEYQTDLWRKSIHANDIQVLKIRNNQDLVEIIRRYLNTKLLATPDAKIQFFSENNFVHAIIILHKRGLNVLSFDNFVYIYKGQMIPLLQGRRLEYTDNLELAETCRQSVSISPYLEANFSLQNGVIAGEWIRGYTLQSYRKIEAHELHQESQLLYAIKRLERFFIDRSSEPIYTEMVSSLEQAIEFLRKDMPGSTEHAKKTFFRGKNALENIFINDKILELLLKEIDNSLLKKGSSSWQQTPFASTNTSPKLEFAQEEEQIV